VTKVIMHTSGVKIGRKRKVDVDHAVAVLDHVKRGYVISVREEHGIWSVSYYLFDGKGDKPFVNSSEGATSSLQTRVHKGTEDARVLDDPFPEWINDLNNHIKRLAPPDMDT